MHKFTRFDLGKMAISSYLPYLNLIIRLNKFTLKVINSRKDKSYL